MLLTTVSFDGYQNACGKLCAKLFPLEMVGSRCTKRSLRTLQGWTEEESKETNEEEVEGRWTRWIKWLTWKKRKRMG